VGLRLLLAPYDVLVAVVFVGRRSWRLPFQGGFSRLRASQVLVVQAPTFPLIAVGSGLAVRCLIGEGFASHSLLFVVNVMGRRGSPLSTSGKISSWSGRLTAYILPPFCSYTSRPVGCNRRYHRSCEAEPFVEVAAWMGHSLGHAGRPLGSEVVP
jgi:hypothetical protein